MGKGFVIQTIANTSKIRALEHLNYLSRGTTFQDLASQQKRLALCFNTLYLLQVGKEI